MAEDTPQSLMEMGVFSGVGGFAFMQFYLKWNGWEAADRLYSNLPLSTEQIMHPEKYAGSRADPTQVKGQTLRMFFPPPGNESIPTPLVNLCCIST